MAEWLIEEGIGEHRAIQLDGDHIVAARIDWPGELAAGLVQDAVLISRSAGSRRGTARFTNGEEALVDKLPSAASEGSSIRLEVTRPAIGERRRRKLAHAKPTDASCRPAPTLAEQLRNEGHQARVVHEFPAGDGSELLAEAFEAEVAFPGGALQFSPTPALLLIDVDGTLEPKALALAAVQPLADALRRFDLGGSIGIDFPTLAEKADRRAVDDALAGALAGWPHERTAMNGFGFVQLVARQERLSLLHRATFQRAGLAARSLLRRAERLQGAGAVLLSGHPALEAQLKPEWLAELARRTGREVRWEANPTLAIAAPQAQLVPR
ncbi:ribonuclease [Altererythrobacter sp. Root672]|uniref:ribonuclease n=1 Tax=Altererythrobacter sp. Root672 TaxID=1736584 RepID=UPI0006FF9D94|nr:ribonuclease [Altererythrobacter sp. Root672]KRA83880.1 ribonuclease [Altererythrobacter sp. Root672]